VDLPEALAWLDTHVNYETGAVPRAGSVGGLSLDRMRALVDVLDEPQHQYPVIHITGTNGKGSTARMIAALLAEAGLSVGTYSSPHLHRLNERISRNGEPISDDDLASVLSDLAGLVPLTGVDPSWFELTTAAAFRWFADVAVDVAVVEVGLLGRFDATNVADGTVAVVTNVGPDHTDFVGDWRRAIAVEKAGIIKPGSTLVLGETDDELRSVFTEAGAAEVFERDEHFGCDENMLAVGGRLLDLRSPNGTIDDVFVPLHGAHQGDNAALALTAAEAFFGRGLGSDVVRDAFAAVTAPGRFEVVRREPLVVLDGAHNAAGAAVAAETLAADFEVAGERILVVGLLAPRDPEPILEALDAATAYLVVACTPDSPRAVPAAEIAAAAARLGVPAEVVPDVRRAVDRAVSRAGSEDAVLVTGSLYVVGAARQHLLGGRGGAARA
jgi:dihydrofolate synthase/folylpolyglutamate synthase